MFLNVDLHSMTEEALMEKLAQINKCIYMVGMGNQMSYDALTRMHQEVTYELSMRAEKRHTTMVLAASRDVNTELPSNITKKQASGKTKTVKATPNTIGAGVGDNKPKLVRSKSPSSDNL